MVCTEFPLDRTVAIRSSAMEMPLPFQRAKARMMEALNVKEVGVGMELCLDGQAAH